MPRLWLYFVLFCLILSALSYSCGRGELQRHPDEGQPVSSDDTELTDDTEPTCPGVCYTRRECDQLHGSDDDGGY